MKDLLLLCTIALFFHQFSIAQVAGTTSTTTTQIQFQENLTNVQLDPNPKVGAASKVSFLQTFSNSNQMNNGSALIESILAANGIIIPGWLTDLVGGIGFFCSGITPSVNMNASVDVGGYYQVHSVGNADIDIDYPVAVSVEYPQANTFGCGDQIRINTSYSILEPNKTDKLKVKTPFVNQEIGAELDNLSFNLNVGLDAYVGYGVTFYYPCETGICSYQVCGNKQYFNESVGFSLGSSLPTPPPILEMCESAFGPGANEASLLSCNAPGGTTPILNLAQSTLDYYNQTHAGTYSFASFPNQHQVDIATPDLPSGVLTLPELGGSFFDVSKNELNFQALNGGKKLKVSGTKTKMSSMYLDILSFADYFGAMTSLSLGGGLGSIDLGDISPTVIVDQDMSFEFDPVVHVQIDLGQSMVYSVYHANDNYSHGGTGRYVNVTAGQYILADYPSDLSSSTNAGGYSYIDGSFQSTLNQQYSKSINLKFAEVNLPNVFTGALVDENTASSQFAQQTIMDHTLQINPGSQMSLDAFTLDPENPTIDVNYLAIEDVINMGGGERGLVYKVGIQNNGDVKLNDVLLQMDLGSSFQNAYSYQIECMYSSDLTVNSTFDGNTDKDLLAAGNGLEVGQTSYVEILVSIIPGSSPILANDCFATVEYDLTAKAYGTSPIGTLVESNYNHCTQMNTGNDLVATVDFGASVINHLEDFAVYSSKKLVFSKDQMISKGNAGAVDEIRFENVSKGGAPPAVIVGDLHSDGKIKLNGHSDVIVDYIQAGDEIKQSGNHSSLTVLGNSNEYSNCVASMSIPAVNLPVNNSQTDIEVKNATYYLAPGYYDKVTLKENAVLQMGSGTYHINHWHFKKDDGIVMYNSLGGPVYIYVDQWKTSSGKNLKFIVTHGSSRDIHYYVGNGGSQHFKGSLVQGNILFPSGNVEFSDGSTLEGRCYAKDITFKDQSSYTEHKFLEELNINPNCQDVIQFSPVQAIESMVLVQDQGQMQAKAELREAWKAEEQDVLISLRSFPNPFLDRVQIEYQVPKDGSVRLLIQDPMGITIDVLQDGFQPKGYYTMSYQIPDAAPSGIYYLSLITKEMKRTRRILKVE